MSAMQLVRRSRPLRAGLTHGINMDTTITPHQTWNRAQLPVEELISDVKTAVFFRKMAHEIDSALVNTSRQLKQTPVAPILGLTETKNTGRYIRTHEWERFGSPMPKDHRELNAVMLKKVEAFNNPAYRRATQVCLLNHYMMHARGVAYQWIGSDWGQGMVTDEEWMITWKTFWVLPAIVAIILVPYFFDHMFPK